MGPGGPRVPEQGRKWAAPWLACAAVSLSAMVFTVPLSGLYFGQFSLVSPLANLCTEWAVVLAFLGGAVSLVAGALFPPLGQALAAVVALPVDYFYWFSPARPAAGAWRPCGWTSASMPGGLSLSTEC